MKRRGGGLLFAPLKIKQLWGFFCIQQSWNNIAVQRLVAVQLRNGDVRCQNGIQGEGQAASCVSADKSEACVRAPLCRAGNARS